MRTALKNKQKLKYALYHERQEIYQTDSEGKLCQRKLETTVQLEKVFSSYKEQTDNRKIVEVKGKP